MSSVPDLIAVPEPRSVLVANLGAPEVNRLSIELEHRQLLQCYVRPYLNRGRWWERALERTPAAGRLYAKTLGRRIAPRGLPLERLVEAGVAQDLLAGAIERLPLFPLSWRKVLAQQLMFVAERKVAQRAAALADGARLVVASYGTGRQSFEAVHRSGGRAVLSYPIAHNDYQARVYAEEADIAPEFAAALPRLADLPDAYSEQLAAECELADLILVGSTFVRESFEALGYDRRRIAVVPYGVDTERFRPRAEPRSSAPFRALFVGQIGQRKGASYLFEGFRRFGQRGAELHVVGSFVRGHEVYRRFASLYRHTPHVPQGELPAVYHDADVFVLPTLIEGMPLVVLEAMACGLPVITTPNGPGDLVRDGVDGFLVPVRDPEAIAARLAQLYSDPELRRQMGRNARQQALRHTWDVFSGRAADLVEHCAIGEVP